MRNKSRRAKALIMMLALIVMSIPMTVYAATEGAALPSRYATFWSLIPPVVAIVLALITKEVYSSLFVGILMGALFYADFNPEKTVVSIFNDGIISVLTSASNVGIVIFLVILGTMVALMNKAGGSAAFGQWASKRIKTRVGAQLATVVLGILIFVDDYFNCLTVGSVMKPISDKHKVSKEKLAYLIDATAAPVCIIAPISSWAAAVAGFVEGEDSLSLFIQSIPFNFYALLTIFMMIAIILLKMDFGPMKAKEELAMKAEAIETNNENTAGKGKVIDLVIPVICLIICCIIGMLYTGGFFSGVDFVTAFSDCNASLSLVLGSFIALVITIAYYMLRRVMNLRECMECLPEGFKAMVPAILILCFAWALNAMTSNLGADVYVATLMKGSAEGLLNLLPAIIFLVACGLAFATGTSWGTFGILIPIVVEVFSGVDHTLMIISISACMAGSVCGDHCSPISDTTIMASAGAQCEHVSHVSTQLPYAIFIAAISFFIYILAGFTRSAWISLPVGMLVTLIALLVIRKITNRKA